MSGRGGVLVAIDVGTSGARAAAYDLGGQCVAEVRRSYPITSPRPGWAEQDPGAWRQEAVAALAGLVGGFLAGRDVLAIGLTGQCPSLVLLDAHDRPVTSGLMYRDNRAIVEAAELRERFGAAALHRLTGHLAAGFHIAPKLLWLQRHEPAAVGRAARLLQPRDLVGLVLTGEAATDGSHAAATLLFDLRARGWHRPTIEALGIDPAILPPVCPSTSVLGGLRLAVAARVGLPAGIPVVLGGADSQACALGAGVVAPGPVSEMAGSSTCLNAVVHEPLAKLEVTHYPHVIEGPLTTETGINTTGAAVAWLADLVYGGRRGRAAPADYVRLDAEAAAVPPGADGILAIPVLGGGERNDPTLRAAFVGISDRHDRAFLARAMLEAVAFAIRGQLELLTDSGTPVTELRVSGGDARLTTWNRIKADVTGLRVVTVPGDAATIGVAMLAGLGAGIYPDLESAMARSVRTGARLEPDAAAHESYERPYARYRELVASAVVRAAIAPA